MKIIEAPRNKSGQEKLYFNFFQTSQSFDFPAGTILGSAKDLRRFQGQQSYESMAEFNPEKRTGFRLGSVWGFPQ
jgi:hypothetical protein